MSNRLVNLANSLSVIRQMVFDEKKFSLLELRGFIRDNWEGHDDVLVDIRKHAHFFGSNDPLGDDLVNRIARSVVEMTRDATPYRGGRYLFGTLTGYEVAHTVLGRETPASPDGRRNGEPFAASISSLPGTDKSGIVGYLGLCRQAGRALLGVLGGGQPDAGKKHGRHRGKAGKAATAAAGIFQNGRRTPANQLLVCR